MPDYSKLQIQDAKVASLLQNEYERQQNCLTLIASENYVSPAVMEAMNNVCGNKYSEGYPGKRYYPGNTVIDQLELLCQERAKQLFQTEHVNAQPLSGGPANLAIYLGLLNLGDKILALSLDQGGHLSHGHPVNFSSKLFNFIFYQLGADGRIDYEALQELTKKEKPRLILAGFSAYPFVIDWQKISDIAKSVDAYSLADISHTAGLVAAGILENPVPLVDVCMTTFHKTLRGPRGAMIMCKERLAKQIDRAVFPGLQGGPHQQTLAGKAVCLLEASQPEFKQYAEQVMANAKTLAQELINLGYTLVGNGTDTHLLVVDLRPQNLIGSEAEKILEEIGILVSRSTVPRDPAPPYNPSGIRLGAAAITTRGLQKAEVKQSAQIIDQALQNKNNPDQLSELKKTVQHLCQQFPLP